LARGIIAVNLRDEDQLVNVALTDGQQDVMLFTSDGKAIRFPESTVRASGRTASGMRGIRVEEGERVIALIIAGPGTILMATSHGYGKRTELEEFSSRGRGGKGVICIRTSERNGEQVGAVLVQESDEIMLISDGGTLVRTRVADVPIVGRATQGVKLIRLSDEERLVGLDRIAYVEDEESDAPDDSTALDPIIH
jgi:DNA gyrase subunit A